jgi:serine/threonine protein phosphatase PrpC
MLQPTRGFGDFIFKKSKGNRGQDIYTALPTVREYPIGPSDKFVILATDGILLGNPNEPQNTIATLCGGAQNRAAQQAPASKRLLTGILNSTEIFGNPIYYPDDVTIIAVDLTVLRRRICAQRILRLVPKSI